MRPSGEPNRDWKSTRASVRIFTRRHRNIMRTPRRNTAFLGRTVSIPRLQSLIAWASPQRRTMFDGAGWPLLVAVFAPAAVLNSGETSQPNAPADEAPGPSGYGVGVPD